MKHHSHRGRAHLDKQEIDRILYLLGDPEIQMKWIATRMDVSETTVQKINAKYKVRTTRTYNRPVSL